MSNNGPPLEPDDPRHGTESGYDYHRCRCRPCTDARTAARRRRENAKKSETNKRNRDNITQNLTPALDANGKIMYDFTEMIPGPDGRTHHDIDRDGAWFGH